MLATTGGPAPASAQKTTGDPCADLGSFALVDPAPAPRGGTLTAQSYQPCADLPGRPQPQIYIDAQVPIGSDGQQDPTTGSNPTPRQRPLHRR
jgi:hypothetical protein